MHKRRTSVCRFASLIGSEHYLNATLTNFSKQKDQSCFQDTVIT